MMEFLRRACVSKIALRNFGRFRMQSSLIILAACIGVSGVLVSSGYAEGGRQKILDRFDKLGADIVTVAPKQSRAVGGRARTGDIVQTLTEGDYRALRAGLTDLSRSAAQISGSFRIRAGDFNKTATVLGTDAAYFPMKHWDIASGMAFDEADQRRQARVALLGYSVAADLFEGADPVGRQILINGTPYIVKGVLSERGQGLDIANEDQEIFIPLETAMHRLLNVTWFSQITLELRDASVMEDGAAAAYRIIHDRHARLSPTADDFKVQNQKSLIDTQIATFDRLSFLIRVVADCALVVSALGIWGLIWIGVRVRSQEVGARRAIGATRLDILNQFLVEAMSGCSLGCAAGCAAAYAALSWIDRLAGQPFALSPRAVGINIATAFLLFILAAGSASLKAADLSPLAALRTE